MRAPIIVADAENNHPMSLSRNNTINWIVLLLSLAVILFPLLAAIGVMKPTPEHQALAIQQSHNSVRIPVFLSYARERIGNQETVLTQSTYFLPTSLNLLSISTIERTEQPVEVKIEMSRFGGLAFIGFVCGALVFITRFFIRASRAGLNKIDR